MELSSRLVDILTDFKEKFGYKLVEHNEPCKYYVFERTTVEEFLEKVILEDHRWEAKEEGFDPRKNPYDVGDWLIFAMTTEFDDGQTNEFPYGLTYSEYKMIERIILELERCDEQADSRSNKENPVDEASGGEQCEEPGCFDGYRYGK